MPALIAILEIIFQRLLLIGLSLLATIGVSPSFNKDAEIILPKEERQEIVQNILSDIQDNKIDLEKNLITDLVTPEIPKISTSTDQKTPAPQPEKPINIIIETIESNSPIKTDSSKIDDVVVNIICTEENGKYINANTGSGVLISENGVVITNAHVGLYFLLDKQFENHECALYKENIPTYGYVAELLYLPPAWIKENKEIIKQENPRGTGENDYAFLYITKNTNPALPKPTRFPYVKAHTEITPEIGQKIEVAGYPGAPTEIGDLTRSVALKKDSSTVKDIFTFGNNNADVISTDATPVAKKGASGGGVFKENNLIALIVTTSGKQSGSHINAITTNYINRSLQNDLGISLDRLIAGNLEQKVSDFWFAFGKSLVKELF